VRTGDSDALGEVPECRRIALSRTAMPGKRVQFDDATWHALDQLAKDRIEETGKKPPAESVTRGGGRKTAGNDNR
jgi:hypothetical protein